MVHTAVCLHGKKVHCKLGNIDQQDAVREANRQQDLGKPTAAANSVQATDKQTTAPMDKERDVALAWSFCFLYFYNSRQGLSGDTQIF